MTAPANGATVAGTVTVTATASDNVGVAGVQFKLDGANLGAEDTTLALLASPGTRRTATNGAAHADRGRARCRRQHHDRDAPSRSRSTTTVTTRARRSSLTAPAGGATVSGTVTVTANASDNVGVAGVQFKLDGANLGAEDTTSPYSRHLEHHDGRERRAHADRGRARRRRQHDDLGRRHRHGLEHRPATRRAWSPPTASTRRSGTSVTDSPGAATPARSPAPTRTSTGKFGAALHVRRRQRLVTIPDATRST